MCRRWLKVSLISLMLIVALIGCEDNNQPPPSSTPNSQSIETSDETEGFFDKRGCLANDFYIDSSGTLYYYSFDESGELNVAPILGDTVSVIDYSNRYNDGSVCDVITLSGDVYMIEWETSDDNYRTPILSKTIEGVNGLYKIVGRNFFLKNDGSLWTFTNYLSKYGYDGDTFPVSADDLDWVCVFNDVQFAATSEDGEVVVVQCKSGDVYSLTGKDSIWQDVKQVATDTQYCSAFFFPHNSPLRGIELYYTTLDHELHRVIISYSGEHNVQIDNNEQVDNNVGSFAAFYTSQVTRYLDGQVNWIANDGEPITWSIDTAEEVNFVVDESFLIHGDNIYIIKSVVWLQDDDNLGTKVEIEDLGTADDEL